MKKKNLMWGALVAIAFASCTQEEVLNDGSGMKTLSVTTEDASNKGSRVGFADQTAAFHWTKGDKIGVTTTASSTTFQGMTLDGNGGEATGTFSGTFNGTASGYAVYPYGESGRHLVTSEGALTYTLPAEYTYSTLDVEYAKTDGNSHNAPMWGSIANSAVSFKHLGGVIAFSVGNLPANTADMKFVLTATNQISGSFTATLAESEPVIASASTNVADADKKVTIHFSTSEGQTSGYFYVPVPTGQLGDLSLVILNGQEEVATGAWDNITISRKDIKRATIGSQSIIGGNGEIKQVASVSNIDAALSTTEDNLTVQVSDEVAGDNTITIPADLQTNTTTFSFSSVADGSKITITDATEGAYDGQIIIEIPEEETLPEVVANIPNGEVYIKQGTVTKLVASSADNTTIIGAKAKIGTLTVEKGNVRIEDGGEVTEIKRSQNNTDDKTYVIYEGALSETSDDESIVYVSAAEWNLRKAVAAGGTVELGTDIILTSCLSISNDVTLKLNGHNIVATGTAFHVTGGTLTVTGEGTVSAASSQKGFCHAVWAAAGSAVAIYGGTFSVDVNEYGGTNTCIFSDGGKITINGGTFSSVAGTLGGGNIIDVEYGTSGKIIINGVDRVCNENVSAYDIEDVTNGLIVDHLILSTSALQVALDAGGIVELNSGFGYSLNSYLSISKDVTLKLNGSGISSDGTAIYVTAGTLTIEGEGYIGGAAIGNTDQCAVWAAGGAVVINGGLFFVGSDENGATNSCIYSTGGTITINGGTFRNTAGTYGGGGVFNVKNDTSGKIIINSVDGVDVGEGSVEYEEADKNNGLIVDNRE